MNYLKEGAKDGVRMATAVVVKYVILGVIMVAIAGGGGYYLYSKLYSPVIAAKEATKEKVVNAKNAVRDAGHATIELSRDAGAAAKDATIRTKDAVVEGAASKVEALREKAPELLEKGKELGGTAINTTKAAGSGMLERYRKWKEGEKPNETK